MTANGKRPKIRLVIEADPETGKVTMAAPDNHGAAYAMLRGAMDMLVNRLLNPEPERKVKTLDEVGIRSRRGL